MFRGGRQVFQVGQASSGPTVIRSLMRAEVQFTDSRAHITCIVA